MNNESGVIVKADGSCNIVKELGELPVGAIVEEEALARMFGRCSASVKRAVERGELPKPVRMFGKPCWTAGKILDFIEKRLETAQLEADKDAERFARFSP